MANYEADAHEAQMKMLRHLLFVPNERFSVLQKAAGLSSDHATFHIKQLVTAKLVRHTPKSYGRYELTRKGKEYANRMDTDEVAIEKQPKLSVVLDIRRMDGKVLQQERLKQPYYGYWGRPTGKIRWGETILEAAARELMEETGLRAKMRVLGFYHKLDYDETGKLLEDKYFCIVRGTEPKGTLLPESDGQRNEWLSDEQYASKEKTFGNLDDIQPFIDSGNQFVFEKKFTYPVDAY